MIDREDMLELTRRMTISRNCFDRIAGAYMNSSGEIDDTVNVNFLKLSEKEKGKMLALAKAIPFSRTNEQLMEYPFTKKGPDSVHQLLLGMRDSSLKNDALTEFFYELASSCYETADDWYIFLFHGTYDIPRKGHDKSFQWESEEVYDFLICAMGELAGKYEPGSPSFGFLFPAFSNRCGDPDRIDFFNTFPEHRQARLMKFMLKG